MNETLKTLQSIVTKVLEKAQKVGASAAEVGLVDESGLSTTVRMGETETVEFNRDKVLSLSIFNGHKKGSVSTSDIRDEALDKAVLSAYRIATYTETDPCAGLAAPTDIAQFIPDLALDYPWDIATEKAIEMAKTCEDSARAFDDRIVNSEGATLSTHRRHYVYGNTLGFLGGYSSTSHGLHCVVIAKSPDKDAMERDYDYTIARDYHDLVAGTTIGQRAAEKTVARLNARKLKTGKAPVLFSPAMARRLWGHLISAISGPSLYQKASFLLDHLNKPVFPKFVNIKTAPYLKKGLGSVPFDAEGVSPKEHALIEQGVLKNYVLGSYSARRLGLKTTGNAGGIHNVSVSTSELDLKGLLKAMGTGLWVTELMGHGVNLVTGDYSQGVMGFWVENGEVQYPVNEVTIAGNLKDMFSNVVAVGNDIDYRGAILTGSVWIEAMTIAGA